MAGMFPAMAAIGGAGSLLGGLLGASGASSAANAQIKAAQDAMKQYGQQTDIGMARQMQFLYGGQKAMDMLKSTMPQSSYYALFCTPANASAMTPAQIARLNELNLQIAKYQGNPSNSAANRGGAGEYGARQDHTLSALQGERDQLMRLQQGGAATPGALDATAFAGGGPGYLQQMQDLATKFGGLGQDQINRYNAATQSLLGQSRGIESMAKNFGKQEGVRIRRDTETANKNADRQSLAALAASGLGDSTLRANQTSANRRLFSNQMQDQLGALGDRQIGLRTGLAGNTLNLANQRAAGASSLGLSMLDANRQMQQAPISAQMQVLTGNAFNPWLGQNTSQYYPGVSGGGAAAQSLGSTLAAMGGQFGNLGMMGMMAQDPNFRSMFGR